jgi:SAM-dependent methyltransferase
VLVEVHAKIELLLRGLPEGERGNRCLLDVGSWDGVHTLERAEALGATRLLGIEVFEEAARGAEQRGIEVGRLDLETERFPWPDGTADVVVCNQVLEHLKNIWLPMSEMHRVLRPGGYGLFSVPNLASVHNRALLALGRQPTSIRLFGPHVRGFTLSEFRELIGCEGAYSIEATRGAGFYPIPSPLSRPLSAVWRGGSHTIIVLARKTAAPAPWASYLDEQAEQEVQTFYARDPASAS